MLQVNISEAKTHLASLVENAARGDVFIIAKSGKPMVMVSPYQAAKKPKKRVGFLKGDISVPDDFDCMGRDEIASYFEDTR